jgi:hypothetical protein
MGLKRPENEQKCLLNSLTAIKDNMAKIKCMYTKWKLFCKCNKKNTVFQQKSDYQRLCNSQK